MRQALSEESARVLGPQIQILTRAVPSDAVGPKELDRDRKRDAVSGALAALGKKGQPADHGRFHLALGECWRLLGEADRAQRAYEAALEGVYRQELPGIFASVWLARGEVHRASGRFPEAIACYNRARRGNLRLHIYAEARCLACYIDMGWKGRSLCLADQLARVVRARRSPAEGEPHWAARFLAWAQQAPSGMLFAHLSAAQHAARVTIRNGLLAVSVRGPAEAAGAAPTPEALLRLARRVLRADLLPESAAAVRRAGEAAGGALTGHWSPPKAQGRDPELAVTFVFDGRVATFAVTDPSLSYPDWQGPRRPRRPQGGGACRGGGSRHRRLRAAPRVRSGRIPARRPRRPRARASGPARRRAPGGSPKRRAPRHGVGGRGAGQAARLRRPGGPPA